MAGGAQLGRQRTARRYKSHADLMTAVRLECATRFEALFERLWDDALAAEWAAWLKSGEPVERSARKALRAIRTALRAGDAFFASHALRYEEDRRGLRARLERIGDQITVRVYLEKETLPPSAGDHFADGLLDSTGEVELARLTRTTRNFLAMGAQAELRHTLDGGGPELRLAYSGELVGLGDSVGILLHAMRSDVTTFQHALRPMLDLAEKAGRPVDWQTRLAVVARWDRDYAIGELRGTRDEKAGRLSTIELAAISILCGSKTSLPRKKAAEEWTPASVIDVERRYIAPLRDVLKALDDRVPVPHYHGGTVESVVSGGGEPQAERADSRSCHPSRPHSNGLGSDAWAGGPP